MPDAPVETGNQNVSSGELAQNWRAENESRRLDLQERQHAMTQGGDAPASSSSGGGIKGSLTRKLGPLPVWAWIGIGAVTAFLAYKHFAGNSTAGTTTAVSDVLPTGSGSGAGGGYSGGQGSGTLPTSTATNPLKGLVQDGGGWWIPNSEQPIQDATSGNWFSWLSQASYQANPTIQRYVQLQPGNFTAVKAGQVLPPGTPQFVMSGAPIPGYTY